MSQLALWQYFFFFLKMSLKNQWNTLYSSGDSSEVETEYVRFTISD
ncbi:MAG: hypothetical protein ACJAR4_002005 [Psychroserpens sp.]|jgi:hypothetical protein